MTYVVGGLIQATDYNGFIATINTPWSTGVNNAGYGQPAFTNVNVGDPIRARPATVLPSGSPGTVAPTWSSTPEWRALVDTINNMSLHQTGATIIAAPDFAGSGSLPVSTISNTGLIAWGSSVTGAITTVSGTQRLNAIAQGGSTPTVATNTTTTWSNSLTFTFTITFANDNAARFFFNSGGQVGITTTHPPGGVYDIDQLISDICSEAGTVWLSSTNGTPATISLAGSTYSGVTKVGGGYPAGATVNTNNGFYALTGADSSLLKQFADFAYHGYTAGSFIEYLANYNGAGVLIIKAVIDEVPDGAVVSTGTESTLTLRFPSTTYLTNTWGTPTVGTAITPV